MPSHRVNYAAVASALLLAWAARDLALAQEPLHVRIDRAIAARLTTPPAPICSDAEFARRIYLDLAGRIPSSSELKVFLADSAADKRVRLIDQLLESPEFARRMMYVFDVMLNQRRNGNSIPHAEWLAYLRDSFAEKKPYNQLVREILASDGEVYRPAGRFYLERGENNLLTRDIARLFFGMDVQCCQCHDHPLVDDYKQTQYYGIYAFLSRSFVFNDEKRKLTLFAEKGEGEVAFKSVFDPQVDEKDFRPRLPGGPILENEPKFAKGQEYIVPPADKVRPIPKFSRREQLARMATDGTNPQFNKNIVNRLWALMLGRGIVHPVEWHHAGNPPSHPELLDELAREFVVMKFNVAALLREIALSQTYQRSGEVPPGMPAEGAEPRFFAVALLKPLSPEQFGWSVLEATGVAENYRQAYAQKTAADGKLSDIFALDEKRQKLRTAHQEQYLYQTLQGHVAAFVPLYGGAEGESEEYQASVHQALFFANGGSIRSWLPTLSGRLVQISDVRAAVDELYLAVLSRLPEDDERLAAVEYLLRHARDRNLGFQELGWALLASTEFRFNH